MILSTFTSDHCFSGQIIKKLIPLAGPRVLTAFLEIEVSWKSRPFLASWSKYWESFLSLHVHHDQYKIARFIHTCLYFYFQMASVLFQKRSEIKERQLTESVYSTTHKKIGTCDNYRIPYRFCKRDTFAKVSDTKVRIRNKYFRVNFVSNDICLVQSELKVLVPKHSFCHNYLYGALLQGSWSWLTIILECVLFVRKRLFRLFCSRIPAIVFIVFAIFVAYCNLIFNAVNACGLPPFFYQFLKFLCTKEKDGYTEEDSSSSRYPWKGLQTNSKRTDKKGVSTASRAKKRKLYQSSGRRTLAVHLLAHYVV